MKVIIFGATGGIGKWAVKHAQKKGYEVTVYVRNAKKMDDTKDIIIIEGNISDNEAVEKALEGQNVVIWCIGIPMKKNYEKKEYLEGHKILINAMKKKGVKRLIDWGTPSISFEKDQISLITTVPKFLAGILFSKAKEEMIEIGELIKQSNLDWTLVRFLAPNDGPYTGKVTVGFGNIWFMNFSISREDIGAFMIEQIENKEFIHSMPIISG